MWIVTLAKVLTAFIALSFSFELVAGRRQKKGADALADACLLLFVAFMAILIVGGVTGCNYGGWLVEIDR